MTEYRLYISDRISRLYLRIFVTLFLKLEHSLSQNSFLKESSNCSRFVIGQCTLVVDFYWLKHPGYFPPIYYRAAITENMYSYYDKILRMLPLSPYFAFTAFICTNALLF